MPRPEIWCNWEEGHDAPAIIANFYKNMRESHSLYVCEQHEALARTTNYSSVQYRYDYYLPLVLAEVGDEVWTGLECAWITLARMRGGS